MDEKVVLQMKGVKKYFPGVKALDGVDFELKKGEIHALLGENGAGKSTLIKILTGIYSMTEGSIHIKGEEVHMKTVKDARDNRIAAIHQEICLVPYISVARNVYLGRELKNKLGLMDDKTMEEETQKLLDRLGMDIDASREVRQYTIAQQQLIEIAKALALDAEILLMDEPTSSLTEKEVTKLFEIIHRLKDNGTSIIYISHRMDELFQLSDRVTVLRDGQYIGTYVTAETTRDELVSAMVGRQLTDFYVKDSVPQDEVYMEVKNLTRTGVFHDISFTLKKGEILGVSGMVGAGRSEVARAIVGIDPKDSGQVLLDGKLLNIQKPKDAIDAGIVLIPENRKEEGLVLENSVRFNTTLAVLDEFIRGVNWNRKKEEAIVDEHAKTLKIRTPHYEQLILNLSGGNQQKVVIAKWLATAPKVLIMDEPTRGVDVGAKAEIYTIMNSLAKQGISIIMISSDLPEIINMSDRVLVMREGKLAGIVEKDQIGQEQIMRYAV